MRRFIFHNAFAIVLSVIMPLSFAVAGELTIYSSEGIQTLPSPDSGLSKIPQHRQPHVLRKRTSRDSGLSKTPQHNHRDEAVVIEHEHKQGRWVFLGDATPEAQKQQNAINAAQEKQARDERNAKEAAEEAAKKAAAAEAKEREKDRQALIEAVKSVPTTIYNYR
ncbi:MAG TPA: hypothetical protein ACFYEC_05675 [Candidatus Brocadiaceae bacterium]